MNNEIKVTKCSECPMMREYIANPIIDGECKASKNVLNILNAYTILPNCPLRGQSITFKIGEARLTNIEKERENE